MNKLKLFVGGLFSMLFVGLGAGVASAQTATTVAPVDVEAEVVGMAGSQVPAIVGILLAVAVIPMSIYLLRWGIKKVVTFVKSGGTASTV